MKPHIIFEDNHLFITIKPFNMPVQEDSSGDPDFLSEIKSFIKKRDKKPGNVFLGLVHRLDRPSGGIMIFAKTSKAASRLSDQFRRKIIEKKYLAVVEGVLDKKKGRLTDFLLKDSKKNMVSVVKASEKASKKAILDYRIKETQNNLSLAEISLITGRAHQIRVQFASRGFPIIGDMKYGKTIKDRKSELALWSSTISFEHPVKKNRITLATPRPKKWPWELFSQL